MKELHDEENTIELIESSEEHLKPSCSNDSPVGCSFLDYQYLEPLSENNLNKAFDILFEEVWKQFQSK